MNCPVCDSRLREVQKHGVEVDICPDCKGIWLDRGELDKIIQMVSQGGSALDVDTNQPSSQKNFDRSDDHDYRKDQNKDHEHKHFDEESDRKIDPRTGKPRRRESWFGEIFDIFGGD